VLHGGMLNSTHSLTVRGLKIPTGTSGINPPLPPVDHPSIQACTCHAWHVSDRRINVYG